MNDTEKNFYFPNVHEQLDIIRGFVENAKIPDNPGHSGKTYTQDAALKALLCLDCMFQKPKDIRCSIKCKDRFNPLQI